MTAEIAVLNRYAVALAADSAVTIGDGSTTKIFQSENKLFQLSEDQPIGIMLYNATSHYGIPWELIIKDFREKHKGFKADLLFDIVPKFLDFLQTAYLPSMKQQSQAVRLSLFDAFSAVRREFSDRLTRLSFQKMRKQKANDVARSLFHAAIDDAIAVRIAWDSLSDEQFADAVKYLSEYEEAFEAAYKRAFKGLPLEDDEKIRLRELAARTIVSTEQD